MFKYIGKLCVQISKVNLNRVAEFNVFVFVSLALCVAKLAKHNNVECTHNNACVISAYFQMIVRHSEQYHQQPDGYATKGAYSPRRTNPFSLPLFC